MMDFIEQNNIYCGPGIPRSVPHLRGRNHRATVGTLNMNHYANKKSAAESMLDVALLMANASQLKAVLEQGPGFTFYNPLITLISISLILQVTVGILLIFIGGHSIFPTNLKALDWWRHGLRVSTIFLIPVIPFFSFKSVKGSAHFGRKER
uniref:Ninjurin 1 n=1 Tax=Salmo trutta TaxID=8032 RepID=A0A674A3B3_SALTR